MSSSLDPDLVVTPDRILGKGHGTAALGPSDTSDSGSDMQSGAALSQGDELELDTSVLTDVDGDFEQLSDVDLGNAGLDSDTDSTGTGEQAAATWQGEVRSNSDIGFDQIVRIGADGEMLPDEEEMDS